MFWDQLLASIHCAAACLPYVSGSILAVASGRTHVVVQGIGREVDMAFVVTVATIDAASVVTWEHGNIHVSDSPFADTIRQFLDGEHNFPVGDKAEPGCTAGFTMERRPIGSDFEMASVLMQLPYETDLDAKVYVHPRTYSSHEGAYIDSNGNLSDAGFHAEMLGDDD